MVPTFYTAALEPEELEVQISKAQRLEPEKKEAPQRLIAGGYQTIIGLSPHPLRLDKI